ncbi:hypothetical protein Gotri_018492 [Gossypium trilobum]|uniref:CBM20 domain-containing protein n=1 Tax=Gossypium trilobum TaxID=34281 RepID=A0A7J9EAH9_9ROSI|nr:hypothetical protein [Gossypium trilobum]
MLGSWDPESSIPLTWSEGHVWAVELIHSETNHREILWQPGHAWIFKSLETENMIVVCEDWEATDYQKVLEEEPLFLDSENLTPSKEELLSDMNLVLDISSSTSLGKEPLQALSKELATGNGAPSLEKPLAVVAENPSYPTKDS